MRISIGTISYQKLIITRDLNPTELAALLSALEGATILKEEGYGSDQTYQLPEEKSRRATDCIRLIDANDDRLPRDLRFKSKEAADKAARTQQSKPSRKAA